MDGSLHRISVRNLKETAQEGTLLSEAQCKYCRRIEGDTTHRIPGVLPRDGRVSARQQR